jgi:hypothetical protein
MALRPRRLIIRAYGVGFGDCLLLTFEYGHRETNTEVPRERLIAELRRNRTFRSTQELEASGKLVLTLTFDL